MSNSLTSVGVSSEVSSYKANEHVAKFISSPCIVCKKLSEVKINSNRIVTYPLDRHGNLLEIIKYLCMKNAANVNIVKAKMYLFFGISYCVKGTLTSCYVL